MSGRFEQFILEEFGPLPADELAARVKEVRSRYYAALARRSAVVRQAKAAARVKEGGDQ